MTDQESEGHDWYNLLDRWGLLEHDTQIARWTRSIAGLVFIASTILAFWSELRQQGSVFNEAKTLTEK
jgi:hypothetical protein